MLNSFYSTEANLLPKYQNKTLTVRLHHLAQFRSDHAAAMRCYELNQTQSVFLRAKISVKEMIRDDFVDIAKSWLSGRLRIQPAVRSWLLLAKTCQRSTDLPARSAEAWALLFCR